MNLLEQLQNVIAPLGLQMESGLFTGPAPQEYLIMVPLSDTFEIHADNRPGVDVQEVRISLFCKGNYIGIKNKLIRTLLDAGLTITARQYIGYETETGYHHYCVDVANYYEMEE